MVQAEQTGASQSTHLGISASLGFNFTYKDCMVVHPSDLHMIWAVGRTVVIKSIDQERNQYLKGHDGRICQLAISSSGALLATGEQMAPGFQAAVIVWDFEKRDMLFRVKYHREAIQTLSFSCNDMYLISLGGLKDGNQLVCWNMQEGRSECAQAASDQNQQECLDARFFNKTPNRFVTGHNGAIKFWTIDEANHKFKQFEVQLAHNRRFVNCLEIDPTDTFLYCGSRSGDILEIFIDTASYKRTGPVHKIFHGGIHQMICGLGPSLWVAAANGCVAKIHKKTFAFEEEVQLGSGPIVSMMKSQTNVYALTAKGNLHSMGEEKQLATQSLFMTSLNTSIGQIAFPAGFSEIFATKCRDEIRMWNVADQKELLRICLAEHEGSAPSCNCLQFAPDGKSIVTGWTDGKVRAFTPQSGKLMYLINNAHRLGGSALSQVSGVTQVALTSERQQGVSTLSCAIDCSTILTGGSDCEVKLWQIGKQTQKLLVSQRQHRTPITAVKHLQNDTQAISASVDGQLILWDMTAKGQAKPLQSLGTMSTPLSKGPDGQILSGIIQLEYNANTHQLLTLGFDKRVTYWDLDKLQVIRQLQASYEVEVNALALSPDGELIITGDETGEVKVFTYADCKLVHLETVHSAGVSAISVSPDNTLIITADEIGHMYFWRI